MFAVPMNGFPASCQGKSLALTPTMIYLFYSAGKLPIPKLQRSSSMTFSLLVECVCIIRRVPSFFNSTHPTSSSAILHLLRQLPSAARLPCPKTSHTIERRYRMSINARIQSLCMAVPALRVLEDWGSNIEKIKKNIKSWLSSKE